MRSLNAKRIAAVAAGAAMLGLALGTAFGACPDISKDWVYDANGNPITQIVVGSNAGIMDGVAAANLAAAIGSKAYAAGQTQTYQPTASGEVKLKVKGATAIPKEGTWNDATYGDTINLNLGEAQGMYTGTVTYNGSDYDYKESVDVNGVTINYYEDKDYHGYYFTNTGSKRIKYTFDFVQSFPNPDGKLSGVAEIKFLGEDYLINEVHSNKIILIKGEKTTLGIGQSTTITVGNTTYTVTLERATIDETTTPPTGHAIVEVSDGTNTYTLDLDTQSTRDGTAGGLYVFLQSVQKEYTPGVGGAATLRIGGEKLTLENNKEFPGYPDWKVKINGDSNGINSIEVYLNENYNDNDQVTKIVGPKNYFTLKYDGTQIDRGEVEVDKFSATGDEDDNYYFIRNISYSDKNEKTYTFDIYDTTDHRVKLFKGDTNGAINGMYINKTNFKKLKDGAYLPLRVGDVFIVKNDPIEIKDIYWDSNPRESYVELGAPGEDGNKYFMEKNETLTSSNYTNYAGAKVNAVLKCGTVDISTNMGSANVTICLAQDEDTVFGDELVVWVTKGAGKEIDSDYYKISWDAPSAFDTSGAYPSLSQVTNEAFTANNTTYVKLDHAGIIDGTEKVVCNGTLLDTSKYDLNATAGSIKVTDSTYNGKSCTINYTYYASAHMNNTKVYLTPTQKTGLSTYTVEYLKSGDYKGVRVKDGSKNVIDQATEDRSRDDNTYEWGSYALMKATDTNAVEFQVPEEEIKLRVNLVPGEATGGVTENEVTVSTSDTFPYDVAPGVTVEDLTCTAEEINVPSSYTFGTVPKNLVITDADTPTASHVIVIGGYAVNNLAKGHTEELTAAGDTVCKFSDDGNTLYVAGYTAQDTVNAVNELIEKINAL